MELSAANQAMWRKERQAIAVREAEEERAFCAERNGIADQVVADAIQVIRNGGVLKNDTVKFYESRYRASSCSIILCLMRRYGIDVPLRTQGWINGSLADVTIKDGYCGCAHFWRSKRGRGSKAFYAYMNELIRAVAEQTPEAGNP